MWLSIWTICTTPRTNKNSSNISAPLSSQRLSWQRRQTCAVTSCSSYPMLRPSATCKTSRNSGQRCEFKPLLSTERAKVEPLQQCKSANARRYAETGGVWFSGMCDYDVLLRLEWFIKTFSRLKGCLDHWKAVETLSVLSVVPHFLSKKDKK